MDDLFKMTPSEFKVARQALGLSIRKCAAFLGRNPRTIQRWEAGELNVPTAEALLLNWLVNGEKPVLPSPLPENRPHRPQHE